MLKHGFLGRYKPSRLRSRAASYRAEENEVSAQMRQPASDGSEEFFEKFTPENERTQDLQTRDVLMGLGLTVGVLLGVGATLWLRKNKGSRRKWWRWFS